MKKWYFLSLAGLVGCTSQSSRPLATPSGSKALIVVVADYSLSYRSLVSLDSNSIGALVAAVATTGGAIAHIAVQDNSSIQSVYLTQIEKLDTASTATEGNLYKAARLRKLNKQHINDFMPAMQKHVSDLLHVTKTYNVGSSYTDLQHGLQLAHSTVCEPIYTNGKTPYRRYVLVLSDMLNDPPPPKSKQFKSMGFCGATILIVRPSPALSQDSLKAICSDAELYVFTTINDAISFINQQQN